MVDIDMAGRLRRLLRPAVLAPAIVLIAAAAAAVGLSRRQPSAATRRFAIELPRAEPGAPTVRFDPALSGRELGLAGPLEVLVNGEPQRGPSMMRAHPSELARVVIDGQPLLVHAPPGGHLWMGDHPCFGWALHAAWLDEEGHARAPEAGRPCPEGYLQDHADYRCPLEARSDDDRCCYQRSTILERVTAGRARLTFKRSEVPLTPDERDDAEGRVRRLDVIAGGCGFVMASSGVDEVALAIGFGETWELAVDGAGRIGGRLR